MYKKQIYYYIDLGDIHKLCGPFFRIFCPLPHCGPFYSVRFIDVDFWQSHPSYHRCLHGFWIPSKSNKKVLQHIPNPDPNKKQIKNICVTAYSHIPDKEWDLQNFWNIFITDHIFHHTLHTFLFCRQARMKALQSSFPDVQEDEEQPKAKGFYFPKPISEAPSPTSTRATSPVSSTQVCIRVHTYPIWIFNVFGNIGFEQKVVFINFFAKFHFPKVLLHKTLK